jgi:hypothetical protein
MASSPPWRPRREKRTQALGNHDGLSTGQLVARQFMARVERCTVRVGCPPIVTDQIAIATVLKHLPSFRHVVLDEMRGF